MYRTFGLHHIFTGPGSIRKFIAEFITMALMFGALWALLMIAPALDQVIIDWKAQ
jgi:hypothetical protein